MESKKVLILNGLFDRVVKHYQLGSYLTKIR